MHNNQSSMLDRGVYQSLFENHPDAVYVLDVDGHFLDVNPMCLQLTGYSREELLYMSTCQLVVPEFAERGQVSRKQASVGDAQRYCTVICHKDGHQIELDVTNTPVLMDGKVLGVFGVAKDITLQKNTERMLEESKQRYESLKRYNPDGICSVDLNGWFIGANPAYEQITGYSRDELLRMHGSEIMYAEDLEMAQRLFKRGKSCQNVETRLRNKDGVRVFVRCSSVPIVIRDETIGWYLIVKDVTKEKSDKQAHIETQRLFALISENSQDIISHITPDGVTRYVSPSVKTLLGYHPEELIGKSNPDMYHPEDLESLRDIALRMTQGEDVSRFICRVQHKDGHYLWYETTLRTTRDDQGNILHITGVGRDITDRIVAEQRLYESESRYHRLVDNSRDAIGIFDNGVWTFMNPAGLAMFGATREEDVVGRSYYDFLHADHHEESRERVRKMRNGEQVGPTEQKWCTLDGGLIYAEVAGIPFGDAAVQVTLRDVTERKRTDELLLQSEKLSAVGQLAAGVAHEIRNPLTALKGFTQLLHKKSRGSNRRYFEIMNAELERIDMILSEMLVLAKPQSVTFKPHDVELILQEVITLLSTQAVMNSIRIEPEFDTGDLVPVVNCEENQLKQVFINIIKNGVEAMTRGGRLLVKLRMEGSSVCIDFVDEGVGIPMDQIPKLGEPFFTTKQEGTGLGLMMSHKIISAHNGTIHIDSEVGRGTTVSVVLPALSADSQ